MPSTRMFAIGIAPATVISLVGPVDGSRMAAKSIASKATATISQAMRMRGSFTSPSRYLSDPNPVFRSTATYGDQPERTPPCGIARRQNAQFIEAPSNYVQADILIPADRRERSQEAIMTDQANPASRPWRRFLRFSMRGMIVVVLVIGGGSGWIAQLARQARIQRDAMAAITKVGGFAFYDWQLVL